MQLYRHQTPVQLNNELLHDAAYVYESSHKAQLDTRWSASQVEAELLKHLGEDAHEHSAGFLVVQKRDYDADEWPDIWDRRYLDIPKCFNSKKGEWVRLPQTAPLTHEESYDPADDMILLHMFRPKNATTTGGVK